MGGAGTVVLIYGRERSRNGNNILNCQFEDCTDCDVTDVAVVKWDSNEDAKKEEKWSIKRLYEFEIHWNGSEAIKRISPY